MLAREIITLLRPHQYIKNLFVFAPLMFSFNMSPAALLDTVVVFALFCALASGIYVLNDLLDAKEDREHPQKRYRPIASGKVSKKIGLLLSLSLSFFALGVSAIFSLELFSILFFYFLLNVAYSLKLKHITIIDIFIIAVGFVLRLFAGNCVLDAHLSMWIIIMTFLLALFLAIAKRRDDVLLASMGKETRKNIDGYNLEFVNAVMVLMSGVIIVAYILYTVSESVIERLHTEYLYLTSFFVILGIMRYMQLTFVEQNSGNPTKIVLKDRFLRFVIAGWMASFFIIAKVV